MEGAISSFCKSLASFCSHVQTSSQALSESIQRRPIPLESAASSFLQSLDRRISATSSGLNLLDSMAFGTISFEELLGHCSEVYNTNSTYISDLQDCMRSFGYIPQLEFDDEDLEVDCKFRSPKNGSARLPFTCSSVSAARSNRKRLENDPIFEDSVSLQNLGLSDACLATLASQDDDYLTRPTNSLRNMMSDDDSRTHVKTEAFEPQKDLKALGESAKKIMIEASMDDYDNFPYYMKSLASWEELQEAVLSMNSYLCRKGTGAAGSYTLNEDDLETLGLGRKGRSYLLMLVRMKQLAMEAIDGSILYRVCVP